MNKPRKPLTKKQLRALPLDKRAAREMREATRRRRAEKFLAFVDRKP